MSERPHPDTGHSKRLEPPRSAVVTALGITQIFAWGCSYYLPAIVAKPIAEGTGWSLAWVVGGLSLGLVVAGAISPIVGRSIHRHGGRPVLIASSIFFAIGLGVIALSQKIEAYLAGWIMIGLGIPLTNAVILGAFVGPSQVSGRLVEITFGRRSILALRTARPWGFFARSKEYHAFSNQ
jgi:predicted MFS family arabinose efflux permease